MCKLGGRDHNATSYSTETCLHGYLTRCSDGRDHNATSYSTETQEFFLRLVVLLAEIITLRAIALKRCRNFYWWHGFCAEIITLRAIALKLVGTVVIFALGQ